ncbi:MAG: hypothetical protein IPG04_16195 [Polyangiaceae bacterium]|nr:hypothetical protein [Polyangiaceae bacterium]
MSRAGSERRPRHSSITGSGVSSDSARPASAIRRRARSSGGAASASSPRAWITALSLALPSSCAAASAVAGATERHSASARITSAVA